MKRGTVIAQLVVFGLISVVVLSVAVFQLLGVRVVDRPYSLTVQLKTAGGIFDSAEVAMRGVQIGRVDDVQLHTDGVTLTLSIDHGVQIPDNAVARITDLSAVGEQYVDFEPGAHPSATPYRAGAVIPVDRTSVPLRTATVLYDLERLIDSVNAKDLQIIGREGAAAFAGTGPALTSLISGSARLVDELSASQDSAVELIGNAAVLLHDAAGATGELTRFSRSLRALSATLASSTPTLDRLLADAPATTRLIDDLARTNAGSFGVLLGNVATLSQIQVARVPGLQALLVAVPTFGRLAPKIVVDGTLNGVVEVDRNDPVCSTGLPLTSPISGRRTPLHEVTCPGSIIARGAANAPRPGAAPAGADASALLAPDGRSEVGGYDAASGLITTSDGTPLRLGLTGGQDRVLGPNSWQALLLAGAHG
ncbi:MAG: MCE family protein [Jatrophihabitans sp.]|uniref:MCE family protein n=1 Tax=Jatrophihabitans sp. TaxID=1932789 RepID=UPI003F7CD60E